jgi:hypothetical protein
MEPSPTNLEIKMKLNLKHDIDFGTSIDGIETV